MAIKTILSITPAIFTGPTPCFAISCLTRREPTALIIFPNSTHFESFSSIISSVSVFFTIKPLYKPQYKFSVSIRLESNFIDFYCVLLDRRSVLNITSTSLPSSPHGGYREKMSTTNSKNCSSMYFV